MTCHSAVLWTQNVGPGLPETGTEGVRYANCLYSKLTKGGEAGDERKPVGNIPLSTLPVDGLGSRAIILHNLSEDFYWHQAISVWLSLPFPSRCFPEIIGPNKVSAGEIVSQALFSRECGLRKSSVSYLLYSLSLHLKALHFGRYFSLIFLSFYGMFSFDNHILNL